MRDKFYIEMYQDSREIKAPMTAADFKMNSFSEIIAKSVKKKVRATVVRVQNPNVDKIPVTF